MDNLVAKFNMPVWSIGAKNTEQIQASPKSMRKRKADELSNKYILYLASRNEWNVEHEIKLANQKT